MQVDQIESDVFKVTLNKDEIKALDEISSPFPELRRHCLAMALNNRFFSTLKKFGNMLVE